ncbi:hypothetical protein GCK32_000511 [Trichostrongylus colubriformis]|uniref:Uncharacterized protein n=1 Tax=Trichostrongylus colubriformis TaxID=6319 RepID=A0AAN8FGW7_TRICO
MASPQSSVDSERLLRTPEHAEWPEQMETDSRAESAIEQLRQNVENLGSNSVRSSDKERHGQLDGNVASDKGLSAADLDAIDPRILKEYAERRLKERTQNSCYIGHSLTLHDGSLLSLPHDGGTGCPINELNDLNNEGSDADAPTAPRWISRCQFGVQAQRNVDRRIYWKLSDIISQLETTGARSCVIVGPTTDVGPAKRDWCRLASALAAAARNGTRTIVVAPPRGDAAYAQNRLELNKATELAKKSVPLMSRNIVSLIPPMESSSEPSHGPSAHPRESPTDAYSVDTMVEYLTAMLDYIKAEMQLPRLVRTSRRAQRVRKYFQERNARYRGARGAHTSQDTHYASSSHRPAPYPAASRGSRGASYRRRRFYGHPSY